MAGKTMPEWIREMTDEVLLEYARNLKNRMESKTLRPTSERVRQDNEANFKACRDEWKRREAKRRRAAQ